MKYGRLFVPLAFTIGCTAEPVYQTVATSDQALVGPTLRFNGSPLFSISPYTRDEFLRISPDFELTDTLAPVLGLGPNGPSILGSSLGGVRADGSILSGVDLVGKTFEAELSAGNTTTIRIDDVDRGTGSNDDVLYYTVSYLQGSWTPLCGYDYTGVPVKALALPGEWDKNAGQRGDGGWLDVDSFFFACQGSSVAKCFEMGFKPWNQGGSNAEVIPQLEACVRALRADYCGDGFAHALPGTIVGVWTDPWAAPAAGHTFEAQWDSQGARCIDRARVAWSPGSAPPCVQNLPSCGISISPDTLLMTSFETSDESEYED